MLMCGFGFVCEMVLLKCDGEVMKLMEVGLVLLLYGLNLYVMNLNVCVMVVVFVK